VRLSAAPTSIFYIAFATFSKEFSGNVKLVFEELLVLI